MKVIIEVEKNKDCGSFIHRNKNGGVTYIHESDCEIIQEKEMNNKISLTKEQFDKLYTFCTNHNDYAATYKHAVLRSWIVKDEIEQAIDMFEKYYEGLFHVEEPHIENCRYLYILAGKAIELLQKRVKELSK
jgi:hypothetical protein